jgi:hypothetical protein
MAHQVERIISGGQTGADRAGLDAARDLGIATGGWAPKGYRTENGPDESLAGFGLKEHDSFGYQARTLANVLEADGTVVFGLTDSVGSRLTIGMCTRHSKPCLLNPTTSGLQHWLDHWRIKTLNVAGNRASVNPSVYAQTYDTLMEALK